jgi:integrase/recombinase XerD
MSKQDFDRLNGTRLSADLTELKHYIREAESKAYEIMDSMIEKNNSFTIDRFKELYFDKQASDQGSCVISALLRREKDLTKNGKISTAVVYKCAANSLTDFVGKSKLPFEQCTPAFFSKYEKWFLSSGKSITTVSIYLRAVRYIFNEGISNGLIARDIYPFGEKKYDIPESRNFKKALTLSEIKQIIDFRFPEGSNKNYYKDLWVFSYLCNGINIKDIALLKYSHVKDDVIIIERAKTSTKNRSNTKKIKIVINQLVGKIIDEYGTKKDYIFDIINDDMDDKQIYNAVHQMVKNINKTMVAVSDLLELPKITTYSARHSFATILRHSGAPDEFISESLGHKNLQTTKLYLKDFEIETAKQWSNKLIPD